MRIGVILVILPFIFLSCTRYEYEEITSFENQSWNKDSLAIYSFDVKDVSTTYNLHYKIRNNLSYPYYNLYLKFRLKEKEGKIVREGIQELILLEPKTGKPYGKGFTDVFQHSFICEENIKFSKPGKYEFEVKQYMRVDNLNGLLSVGMALEKN